MGNAKAKCNAQGRDDAELHMHGYVRDYHLRGSDYCVAVITFLAKENQMKTWLILWMLWCCTGVGLTLAGCCIRGQILWYIDPLGLIIDYASLACFVLLYREEERRDASKV